MNTRTAARIDRGLTVVTVVLAVVVLAVVVWFVSMVGFGLGGPSDLERAADHCGTTAGDDGQSVHVTDTETAACVLEQLDAPDSMVGKLIDTRAIDGRQEDSWDDYDASWTYHPDDGLRLVVEQKD